MKTQKLPKINSFHWQIDLYRLVYGAPSAKRLIKFDPEKYSEYDRNVNKTLNFIFDILAALSETIEVSV